jgi:hypothetical protein
MRFVCRFLLNSPHGHLPTIPPADSNPDQSRSDVCQGIGHPLQFPLGRFAAANCFTCL